MNYNEAVNIVKSEIIPFIKPGNSGLSKVHLKLLYSCIKSTRSEFLTHDIRKFTIKKHLIYCFLNDIQPSKYVLYHNIQNYKRIIEPISLKEYAKKYISNRSNCRTKYLKSIFYHGLDLKYPKIITYSDERIRKILKRLNTKHDKCIICGKYFKNYENIKFKRKTCSKKCYNKRMSEKMLGNLNPSIKYGCSECTRKKLSESLKRLILEGKFTPCITNSWSDSKVVYKNIEFRSVWELYFYYYNTVILKNEILYEYTRILYYNTLENVYRNYIVDFTDLKNKILYEVKPKSLVDSQTVKDKENEAIRWCEKNGYSYIFITDEWFKQYCSQNIIEQMELSDHEKKKVHRCLKGFLNENKSN